MRPRRIRVPEESTQFTNLIGETEYIWETSGYFPDIDTWAVRLYCGEPCVYIKRIHGKWKEVLSPYGGKPRTIIPEAIIAEENAQYAEVVAMLTGEPVRQPLTTADLTELIG